jgi:hypothetical protein
LSNDLSGKLFVVDRLLKEDIERGEMKTSWLPSFSNPNSLDFAPTAAGEIPREAISKHILSGSLLAISRGAWDVSNEWNQLLPEMKFTGIEEFLRPHWIGKP